MATCLIYEIQTGDGNICYKNTEKDAIAFCEKDPNASYERVVVTVK